MRLIDFKGLRLRDSKATAKRPRIDAAWVLYCISKFRGPCRHLALEMVTLPGTARPIDHYLGQATPCLQSQFGQGRYLAMRRTAQVMVVVGLSVVVRCGPVRTAVNGTVVARPVRMIHGTPWRRWFQPSTGG
jgi:hypothetical protein